MQTSHWHNVKPLKTISSSSFVPWYVAIATEMSGWLNSVGYLLDVSSVIEQTLGFS